MVADPLRLFDCSPVTDGAAAVLLTTVDEAKKLGKHPLVVIREWSRYRLYPTRTEKRYSAVGSC